MNGNAEISSPPKQPVSSRFSDARFVRKAVLAGAGIAVLAIALWFGATALIRLPWRVVNEVVVHGSRYTSAEDIRSHGDVPLGAPLFGVATDSVIARVKSVPWVASAKITRRLSGTYEIHVNERTPVGMFWDAGFCMVDPTGYEARVAGTELPDVPVISGLSSSDSLRSVQLASIANMLGDIAALPQLQPIVSEISLADDDYIVLVLTPGGVPVWLPKTADRGRLVALASLATHHPGVLRRARYVDGRFSGHLAVRN